MLNVIGRAETMAMASDNGNGRRMNGPTSGARCGSKQVTSQNVVVEDAWMSAGPHRPSCSVASARSEGTGRGMRI